MPRPRPQLIRTSASSDTASAAAIVLATAPNTAVPRTTNDAHRARGARSVVSLRTLFLFGALLIAATVDGADTISAAAGPRGVGAEISGQKFDDVDGDGAGREPGEPGLDGWLIQLLDQNGDPVAEQSTHSEDVNGNGMIDPETERGLYRFTGVASGTYTVAEVLQPGRRQTFPQILTERVSVDSMGVAGDRPSADPAMSADGRFIAFESTARNLVTGDTNNVSDIFVFDRQTDTIERVNLNNTAGQALFGGSFNPSISADGRFVAFDSTATNLVTGDSNSAGDVFVYDRQTDTIERVSVNSMGGQTNFGGLSETPSISADGRFVAFASLANNLVPSDTNFSEDVFVYDRDIDTVERVSVDSAGMQADQSSSNEVISADGRFVAFQSGATNLVPMDTNTFTDIFVYDRQTDTIARVSVTSAGAQAAGGGSFEPSISGDGRFVAFGSQATNLVPQDTNTFSDVFVIDRQTGAVERVSVDSVGNQGDRLSSGAAISADGQFVAFDSRATHLVPDDTNNAHEVFVFDRETRITERVSVDSVGKQAVCPNSLCGFAAAISGDGRVVAFQSVATNLVPGDTLMVEDVFVRAHRGVHSVIATGGVTAGRDFGNTPACSTTITTPLDVVDPNDAVNSLREAILCANSTPQAEVIAVPAGTYTLTLGSESEDAASEGDLDILGGVTISGAGAATTIIQGCDSSGGPCDGIDRVFEMISRAASISVTISGVTIQNGFVFDEPDGGGIAADGHLTLTDAVVRDNRSQLSGGIYVCGNSDAVVTMSNVTVSGNAAIETGHGGDAGGIWFECGMHMTITGSTISGNTSTGNGGGITNDEAMTITNSTISGNTADEDGGGIINTGGVGSGAVTLMNVTITNNTADGDNDGAGNGGGIFSSAGDVTNLVNTVLAGNQDRGGQTPDCSGPLTSQGHNLIQSTAGCTVGGTTTGNVTGQGALLLPLAANGGQTATHALCTGVAMPSASCTARSPAIDTANPSAPGSGSPACAANDQRGVARPADGDGNGNARCDIGAFEAGAAAPGITPTPTSTATRTATPMSTGGVLTPATATTTPTRTATVTPTSFTTGSPTSTRTPTPSLTPTRTSTPVSTPSATRTSTTTATRTPPPGLVDHYRCYTVKTAKGAAKFEPIPDVRLVDDFEDRLAEVQRPRTLCAPADKNDEGIIDPATHLEQYRIKPAKMPRHIPRTALRIDNQLGTVFLDTARPEEIFVPTAKNLATVAAPPDPAQHNVDHYECYKVKPTRGTPPFPAGLEVTVEDQFTTPAKRYALRKPTRLCTPVETNGEPRRNDQDLLCYTTRLAKKRCTEAAPANPGASCKREPDCGGTQRVTAFCVAQARFAKVTNVHTANQFGSERLDVANEAELCVPSVRMP